MGEAIMASIKQKKRARNQRMRLRVHKRSILSISAVILLLVAVVTVNGISLQAKEKEYNAQVEELQSQLADEKAKADEIEELEKYVGTDEYIEEIAKEKMGLVYPNEIIFKPEQ